MAKSLFVTATGTDVGKTYISALIVKKLKELRKNCTYYKPVLSGAFYEANKLIPGDCRYVVENAKLEIEPMECVTYCFEEAVSPHLAAKRKGIEITEEKILADFEARKLEYDYVLIEGAGGITCPLNMDKNYLLNDLIKKMDTNCVIVADGGLGTLNHMLLTAEYAKSRNLKVAGIIINNYDKKNFMHIDNRIFLEKLTGIKVIATVAKDDTELHIANNEFLNLFGDV